MALAAGSRLGQYEITGLLGVGGMGEVYRARDPRLRRDIALKVLPPDVAANAERRMRFEQEARAVASLNHPNIVTLYSLEEAGGTLFITLELVEGETLAARLARGRPPLAFVLQTMSAVADAASWAHGHGILHRDLKPANVMVTDDDRVKVLDFGLAKLTDDAGDTRTATLDTHAGLVTERHVLLGTPAYMSPEQVEHRAVDERSDIFALGVILYEMTTGQRPFQGASAMSVLASVLADTPRPIAELNPLAPPGLAGIADRCLAKDPAQRYRRAADLRDDLRRLHERGAGPAAADVRIGSAGTPARASVAVLPFLNLSADPENEFFADGITEDVIARLSTMRSLKVISRTSAMQFKKREASLREIAARLAVSALVDGSVRKAGNRVRIVAQLVDASTDEHLWSATYDRQLTDIFEIQSEVALKIADALETEMTPGERARVAGAAAVDLQAYQLYLKGRQQFHRMTQSEVAEALALFERAVAIEPRYALAHNSIAWVYLLQAGGHGAATMRPAEAYARARTAVERALEADASCGDAHGTLGTLRCWGDYDWTGAEASFRRGLELNPGAAFMLDTFAQVLNAQERFDEALSVLRRARELDPLAPVIGSDLATTCLRAGRFDDARDEARRLIDVDGSFPYGHAALGWARLFQGFPDEGLAELQQAAALSPGNTIFLAQLGEAYGLAGRLDEARAVLATLQRLAAERYVMPYHFAYVYTGLGDQERAIDLLEQAVEERAGGVYGVKGSFLFTTLREHPRFKALLRRMNLDDRYRSGGVRPAQAPADRLSRGRVEVEAVAEELP